MYYIATEEIALRSGSVIGSVSNGYLINKGILLTRWKKNQLLNATFGNAVELILGMIALKEGLVRVVQGKKKKKKTSGWRYCLI